ncbi:class I SAM-dependent methyltransferase [Bradyrhizobium sp. CB3481]|uniref:class I SAM-dependent methyltransferase n=1 Tax=Bradyrhizobium sp. CB3481 TaxID=3039158 RepID=UPI0024B11C98|nr:class I SAM-dependent methyltransferase [Bradyrhizobium sp. CB3481]WFU18791.1 class I SAM-dependent methyltransferase [Bradyrhizobium sp. CB3481]
MSNEKSLQSEKYLSQVDIHSQWQSDYLNPELDRFYDLAFADIVKVLNARPQDKILDAGCGYCYHTTRLARSGATITAVDFSDAALAAAQHTIARAGVADRVNLQQADLTKLPFPDNSFDFVVSWGVLMHIPELEAALAELSRVLKPAGVLVLCENNVNSLDVTIRERAVNVIKKLIGRTVPEMRKTKSGTEAWIKEEGGGLMVRKTRISFLAEFLKTRGLIEFERTAGQFTELYTNLPSKTLKRLVYALNMLYYTRVRLPSPAMGNIIYYRKI